MIDPQANSGLTDAELAIHPTVFAADALKDQVVIVSGGAGGIGRAIAWLFARLGAHVAVVGRDRGRLDTVVADLASRQLKASAHVADIREPDQVNALFDAVWAAHGRVDSLINSAGGQFPQAAIDFSIKGWNAVIDTNLNGTWYMMQAAAQRWRDHKHPGSIVNIVVVTTHGLYAAGARGLPALESDDARGLALGYRGSLRLPRRTVWRICHRRNADGGRRRSALGRDVDDGEAGVVWWWARVREETSHLPLQHCHVQATADFHPLPPVERDGAVVLGKYMQEGNLTACRNLAGNGPEQDLPVTAATVIRMHAYGRYLGIIGGLHALARHRNKLSADPNSKKRS